MVGTTTEGLRHEVDALVRDGKIRRAAVGELMVVYELTARERNSLRRYVDRLDVEAVGPAYL